MHKLSPNEFFRLVPRHLRASLHTGNVVVRLQQHYCPAMQRQNKCTNNCLNCKGNLNKILQDLQNWKNPRDIYACLVWSIRNTVADIAEAEEEQGAVNRTNWLGEKVEANPFELALEEL